MIYFSINTILYATVISTKITSKDYDTEWKELH